MVRSKSALVLLLTELLAVTAKDALSLNCKKKKGKDYICNFGDPIEVSFRIKDHPPVEGGNDWIGIQDKDKNDAMWTHTCGFQYTYPGDLCPNLTSGTVVFDGVDPSEADHQNWPLSPGTYKVCHLDYNYGLLQKCKKFKVELDKKTKKKILKKAMVTPTKAVYDYGEDILADFDAVVSLPNTKVSIRSKHWKSSDQRSVYTGCNNIDGDQRWSYYLSDDCLKTQKSGKVIFSPDNFNFYGQYLSPGEYEMRILYYNMYAGDDIIEDPLAEFSINPKPTSSKSPSSKSPQ